MALVAPAAPAPPRLLARRPQPGRPLHRKAQCHVFGGNAVAAQTPPTPVPARADALPYTEAARCPVPPPPPSHPRAVLSGGSAGAPHTQRPARARPLWTHLMQGRLQQLLPARPRPLPRLFVLTTRHTSPAAPSDGARPACGIGPADRTIWRGLPFPAGMHGRLCRRPNRGPQHGQRRRCPPPPHRAPFLHFPPRVLPVGRHVCFGPEAPNHLYRRGVSYHPDFFQQLARLFSYTRTRCAPMCWGTLRRHMFCRRARARSAPVLLAALVPVTMKAPPQPTCALGHNM